MAVYKRGYQRYEGVRTGRFARLMVLPGYTWRNMLKKRLMVSLLIMSMFYPIFCIVFLYLSNNLDVLVNIGAGLDNKFLQIDSRFFLTFMWVQAGFSIVISVFAGPSLVAPDLSNNALQLYFSRPFSRAEYVFSRMMVLLGLLFLVTWIPGLVLFFMQSCMAGWDWFAQNWNLGLGVFIGLLLWIMLVSLVAMAGSAYVRKRIMAEAFILAVFFIPIVGANIFNNLFNVTWASLLNPWQVINQIWHWLLGATTESGPTVFNCWLAFFAMITLLLAVLRRKLRPVEVVS